MWRRLGCARRREDAEQERQEQTLRHLVFLRDKIFAQPDIARMYWHTLHPGDLGTLSSDHFTTIAEQISPTEALPAAGEHPVSELLREFIAGLSDGERAHLIRQLGVAFRGFHRDDLADRLDILQQEPTQEADR